jgi:outer membrane lipoprotein-sorting protein
MNPLDPTPEPLDLLARAEAALRNEAAPEGPSADLIARTRAALRNADDRLELNPNLRRKMMVMILKYAAAAVLAASAAGLPYLATAPRAKATTFSEAVQKLHDAHTLSFKLSFKLPGQDKPTTGREFYKDPGLVRTEYDMPNDAVVVIHDAARGKILSLDQKSKTAILQDLKFADDVNRRLQDRAANTASHLRSLAGKPEKPVGKRKIGDIEAEGFRVEDPKDALNIVWTVWVDPKERLPLLMETVIHIQDRDMSASLSDFVIDAQLDDDLFRLDPPEGYALKKVDAPVAIREEALINFLRYYTEASGGAFPPKFNDPKDFQKRFPKEKWTGPTDPQMIRVVQSMAASVGFLELELKNAYGYAPDRVKLGDAGKVLFWYHPKDSPKYRAIFGDLHAEDVTADRLPEKPKF